MKTQNFFTRNQKSISWLIAVLLFMFFSGQVFSQIFPCGYNGEKVKVCHNGQTLCIAQAALAAHLGHGDDFGPCPDDCIDPSLISQDIACIAVYLPVCGCDGITYSNGCVAIYQNGVTAFTNGVCGCINPDLIDPDAVCTMVYDPVCGCDR